MTNAAAAPRVWTAREVAAALFHHFSGQGWAVIPEVEAHSEESFRDLIHAGVLTGEAYERTRARRADLLLVRKPRKESIGSVELLAVEIKVSRTDFTMDVRNPYKQALWRRIAHRHAYATPAHLARPHEVPHNSGLLHITQDKGAPRYSVVEWAKRAPYTDTAPVPAWLTLTAAHRASWAEGRLRGWLMRQQGQDDDPEFLRGEAERLRSELDKANKRADREHGLLVGWREAYALAGGLPCAFCGEEIRPHVTVARGIDKWMHRRKAAEDGCLALREAAAEQEARDRYEQMPERDRERLRDLGYYDRYPPGEEWRFGAVVERPRPAEPTQEDEEIPA